MDKNNEIKKIKDYTAWINYLSFWYFIWFIMYLIKIIKIPPSIWFYIGAIIYIIFKIFFILSDNYLNRIENYKVFIIQLTSTIILDIVPLLFYNKLGFILNFNNILINLIFLIVYIIYIKIKFQYIYKKDKSLNESLNKIYYEYNNIFSIPKITIKDYFYLKYRF
jgi:hypothetical protein